MVAEPLRSQGIGAWFAEYNISSRSRQRFQELIDNAIRECSYGICFTNDLYVQSEHCVAEARQLLARLPIENIVEVALPRGQLAHDVLPGLARARHVEVAIQPTRSESSALTVTDANRILEAITRTTNIEIQSCGHATPSHSACIQRRARWIRYSIDLAGWRLKKPSWLTVLRMGRALGPMYELRLPNGQFISGQILTGPQDVTRKKVRIGTSDDREYYEEALKFADAFLTRLRSHKCIGVHLIFSCGLSHPAFTSTDTSAGILMGRQRWVRMYSIVLPGRWRWSKDVEFGFFFYFRGSLKSFLESAHIMDRLVLSFRLEP